MLLVLFHYVLKLHALENCPDFKNRTSQAKPSKNTQEKLFTSPAVNFSNAWANNQG